MPPVDVRRGADRQRSAGPGRATAHSFSFGAAYDPGNVGFGVLVAVNDEHLEPGAGYAAHRHRDVEILTWVVAGVLTHRDADGTATRVPAGSVQVQSAGRGLTHSESVDAGDPPTRFVQSWLRSRGAGEPAYAVGGVRPGPDWTVLASGRPGPPGLARLDAAATAYAARSVGDLALPAAPLLHLLVVRGSVRLTAGGQEAGLADGDAVRLTGVPGARVDGDAELLLWALDR